MGRAWSEDWAKGFPRKRESIIQGVAMKEKDLFEWAQEAQQRRNEGIRRVTAKAAKSPEYEAWKEEAQALVVRLIREKGEVCSDEVTPLLPPPEGVHNSTWSAIFAGMSRQGVIECIRVQKSRKPVNHAMLVRVWVLGDARPLPDKES
jgi:hypothetical protein